MTPVSLLPRSALLAALAASLPLPLAAAPAGDTALGQASDALRQAWRQDPLTASRPFPAIRVLDSLSGADCPSIPFPASAVLVVACPASGAILVKRAPLAALHGVFGEAAALFVLAYGLGQGLTPPSAAAPPATSALRAACAAGTLLAAMPVPAADRRLLLNNAISAGEQAFPSSAAPQLGTGPQRAYALLSGMGGTSLTCGDAAMDRLASGAEPLEAFLATRGTSVGIEKFCRQPPACPRGLSFGVAGI